MTTVRRGADGWLDSTNTSTNYGDGQRLGIKSGSMYPIIWFATPFPLGANISSATLNIYAKGAWGVTPTVTARRITSTWKESTVTYATTPTVLGTTAAAVTQASPTDGTLWSFDLTSMFQNVADGAAYYGVRLETTDATQRFFYALESPDFKPSLSITFSEKPDAPTDLVPSGNQAVGIGKPVLRFTFTDFGGDAMQALQVQANATASWATPTFDSGIVTATEPELDLASTAYVALANNTGQFWRVRAQDATGLWSPWSDAAQFRRDNKGTLAISSPTSTTIADATPPILWTLTGETQTAWRVWILRDDDPTVVRADSGKNAGSTATWTPPKGAITRLDVTYRIRLRIWDSKDRANTPGDGAYTQVERAVTFTEDATVTAVTGLTATANIVTLQPHVHLNWTAATAPDRYNILRNGDVIDTVLPVDVLVSGTSYEYVDKEARRGTTHTWKIQRVVNNKASASNPSVTTTVTAAGIWLSDNTRDLHVFIAATGSSTWSMGEAGDTFSPLGTAASVRIWQGIRGWEGNVAGMLIEYGANTADQWADNALDLRSREARNVYVLHVGREAFRVRVFNFVVSPHSQPSPTTRTISFDFIQTSAQRYAPRL